MRYWQDYINVPQSERWTLPVEPASVPGYVKHVICDGSRDHVFSYEGWESRKYPLGTIGVTRCSVPNCIANLERAERLREAGHDVPDPVQQFSPTLDDAGGGG